MKGKAIDGEGQIDWQLLRKVYRHATKQVRHPEPDAVHFQSSRAIRDMGEELQRQLDLIIDEINQRNDEFLTYLEAKLTGELNKLQHRIEDLERTLDLIQQKQPNYPTTQMHVAAEGETPSKESSRSFIYI